MYRVEHRWAVKQSICCPRPEAAVVFSVLHLFKELVGWVFIAVLLHFGQVALLGGHGSINLLKEQSRRLTSFGGGPGEKRYK